MKLVVIDYGTGNVCSLMFALKRLGCNAILSNNPKEIIHSDKIIFPGVGEAGNAKKNLIQTGLHKIIPNLKQPVLGICIGMQLMCRHTEEGNTHGLGIFDINIKKFSNQIRVPQIGWNSIYKMKSSLFDGISENSYMYLVHSFYAPISNYTIAHIDYGGTYSGALNRDNFYGVQFHPEKSSKIGSKILENFINF